jgi:hypothetical protein
MGYYISRSFNKGRDGDLVTAAHRVVVSLKDNADFPNPPKPVTALEQALEDYRTALANAAGRDKALVAVKNDKRAVLRSLLAELADYVETAGNNEKSILLKSGFDLAGKKGGISLRPITDLAVETDSPAQAVTSVKLVVGARAYVHEYTTDPALSETSWIGKITSDRRYTVNNLASGVKHHFRVRAVGAGGQTVQSPVVSRYIQ